MSKMGRYCKAYPIDRLQAFDGWPEAYRREVAKEPPAEVSGNGEPHDGTSNSQPAENDYLFVQEDLTVTKGIFLEEDVVFDQVTPQWADFCKNELRFEIPPDVADASEKAAGAS